MFGAKHKILTLFGFDVHVDASWIFLALLVSWSFAKGVFPAELPGLTSANYWLMGIGAAIGLFASIILHELSHSLVARRYGIQMRGITLFIFGGVAEMENEPPSARSEFNMAIAGPIASLIIGGICKAAAAMTAALPQISVVFGHLAIINIALAIFNMIPAFPLDGGRALRAFLWGRHNDLMRATRTAAKLGQLLGLGLIGLGVLFLLGGGGIGALWWGLIGLFVNMLARAEYSRLQARNVLGELSVKDLMSHPVEVVDVQTPISDFLERHVYHSFHDLYPVVDQGRLCGAVTVRALSAVPKDQWSATPVETVMTKVDAANWAPPEMSAAEALKRLQSNGASRLLVLDQGNLVGILVLKDLMKPLSIHAVVDEA
ncbi:MAG: site-2 protease family protein [Sphingomonadales bacterium]|jgi:Zn-dependent protease